MVAMDASLDLQPSLGSSISTTRQHLTGQDHIRINDAIVLSRMNKRHICKMAGHTWIGPPGDEG